MSGYSNQGKVMKKTVRVPMLVTQKPTVQTLLALQKCFFLWVKNEKKSALMALFLEYDAFIFFFLFFFSCFFFVLTQKATIQTLLALQKSMFLALGQKRKKIISDAFVFNYDAHMFL